MFVCKAGDFNIKTVFNDKWINLSVIASLGLLMAVLYLPVFNSVFNTVALNTQHWLYLVPLSLPALFVPSIVKLIKKTSQ